MLLNSSQKAMSTWWLNKDGELNPLRVLEQVFKLALASLNTG
jgi:hypothetical protein